MARLLRQRAPGRQARRDGRGKSGGCPTCRQERILEERSVDSIHHFIDGKAAPGRSGRAGDVFNPATGEVSGRVDFASAEEAGAAIDAARKALPGWAATPPVIRARVMFRFKQLIEENIEELARDRHRRARQGAVRRQGVDPARPRGGRVRLRHPASAEGRVQRECRARDRQLVDPPAARRLRRHHAVQLPGDGAAVDVPGGASPAATPSS